MSVNLELPGDFKILERVLGILWCGFNSTFFSVQNSEGSSSPAAQMVTAWLTSPHTHPSSFFPSVNYAGKGLLSTQACSQHGNGFSLIRLHIVTLGSRPVQPQSFAYCPREQLGARCPA